LEALQASQSGTYNRNDGPKFGIAFSSHLYQRAIRFNCVIGEQMNEEINYVHDEPRRIQNLEEDKHLKAQMRAYLNKSTIIN